MRIMKKILSAVLVTLMSMNVYATKSVEVGAAQVKEYVPMLKGKRVAL